MPKEMTAPEGMGEKAQGNDICTNTVSSNNTHHGADAHTETSEELIIKTAEEILDRYIEAFKELAK